MNRPSKDRKARITIALTVVVGVACCYASLQSVSGAEQLFVAIIAVANMGISLIGTASLMRDRSKEDAGGVKP